MKRSAILIILFIICVFATNTSQASRVFNLTDFCDKEWYVDIPKDENDDEELIKQGWSFSKNGEVTSFMFCNDGKHVGVVKFYLSDTPATVFDHNMISKATRGRYIVTLNKANYICNFEIIDITFTRMIVRNMIYGFILNFTTD